MRMWMVNPGGMCDKHLLGEHYELHMIAGHVRSGRSLAGFFHNKLIDTSALVQRHSEIVDELVRRGVNHKSELEVEVPSPGGEVDILRSFYELVTRCPKCRRRWAVVDGQVLLKKEYRPSELLKGIAGTSFPIRN